MYSYLRDTTLGHSNEMSMIWSPVLRIAPAFLFAGAFVVGLVFGPQTVSATLLDVNPGAVNGVNAATPTLPPPYDGMGLINLLSPAVTLGVKVTSVDFVAGDTQASPFLVALTLEL